VDCFQTFRQRCRRRLNTAILPVSTGIDVAIFSVAGDMCLLLNRELGITGKERNQAVFSSIPILLLTSQSPHFTPTNASRLNLVERWIADLTTKWIRHAHHRSVRDLVASIGTKIVNRNDDPKPSVWYKTADQILDSLSAYRQTTQ
jgi:hypothetical protein